MKIIHVPRRFVRSHWGGTETVILETCRALQAKGHETSVVCSSALADNKQETIDSIPVTRFSYFYPWFGLGQEAMRRLDQKGGNLFSFSLLRSLKRETGLDLIHLHTAKRLGGIVRHVAQQRNIPYVVSIHGGFLDVPKVEALTWTEPTEGKIEWGKILGWWVGSRRVFDDAAAIICLGNDEFRMMRGQYPNSNVVQLPNGVNTQRFAKGDGSEFRRKHKIPDNAPLILVMGRIDPQKNQLLAVEAFAEVRRRIPDAHLLLIGHVTNDIYAVRVREAINAHGLTGAVTLIPGIASSSDDLVNAFHAADLFFLPSTHEPFGIVILEAWAAGLPVVASRVGGIPSFVEDGHDGLLFTSENVQDAVEKLDAALTRIDLARSLADSGKAKAEGRFSWSCIVDRLITIYEEAIRARSLR